MSRCGCDRVAEVDIEPGLHHRCGDGAVHCDAHPWIEGFVPDDAGADRVRSILDPIIVGGSLMGDLYDTLHDRGRVITHGVGKCI
jgi:hypothetical protein